MADYLVDTDVLVDHLRRARRFEPGEDAVTYSVITRCELFAGQATDEVVVRALLSTMTELNLDGSIAEHGGRIRRETGIPTPDALIAATALAHKVPLLTRNRRHFKRVPGLALQPSAG